MVILMKFMSWKNCSCWLKGGIIAVLVLHIFLLFSKYIFNFWSYLPLPLHFILGSVYSLIDINLPAQHIVIYFATIIHYFILGSIIGLLVGKIKKERGGASLGLGRKEKKRRALLDKDAPKVRDFDQNSA